MSQKKPTDRNLDEFTRAYVEAALWSTSDESTEQGGEPFDANYGPDDIAPETMELMVEDCRDFVERFGRLIEDDDSPAIQKHGLWSMAGHDFWLTREGHGSGYWDGDWPKHGDELTAASKEYGNFELYLGDDQVIYGPPPEHYRHPPDWLKKRHPALGRGRVNELAEHRDARTGQFAAGPDPTGEWAVVQRMMEVYARQRGLGAYVHNSAIPAGNGDWRFWAQKPGERSKEHQVSQQTLKSTYDRGGLSERRAAPPQHRHRRHGAPRGRSAPPRGSGAGVRDYDVVDNRGKRLAGPFKDYGTAKGEAETRGGVVGFVAGERAAGRLDSRLRGGQEHEVGCPMREASRRKATRRPPPKRSSGRSKPSAISVTSMDRPDLNGSWTVTTQLNSEGDGWWWIALHNGSEAKSGSGRTKAEAEEQGRLYLQDIQAIAKGGAKGWAKRRHGRARETGHALLSRHGSKMMAAEARGQRRKLREGPDAEEAGERYATDQIESDHFKDWVWDQMVEGRRMRNADPNSVIPLDSAADYKKLAQNMLQQLGWDVDRDMDPREVLAVVGVDSEGSAQDSEVVREFFRGLKSVLKKPSVVNWLASECRAMEKELKSQERAKGRKRKAGEAPQTTRLLPPAPTR